MRLSTRETWVVIAGGLLVTGMGFWLIVWEPTRGHIDKLDQKLQTKRAEYRDVQELAHRLRRLTTSTAKVKERLSRSKGFFVRSYLENLAVEHKIRNRITQMREKGGRATRHFQDNAFEVKMEKVSLPEVVSYLFDLEHPKRVEDSMGFLRITQLRLRQRSEDKNLLDVVFQVSSYEPLEKG